MNNIKDNLQIINQINNKYPNLISQSNSKKLDIMYKHLDSNIYEQFQHVLFIEKHGYNWYHLPELSKKAKYLPLLGSKKRHGTGILCRAKYPNGKYKILLQKRHPSINGKWNIPGGSNDYEHLDIAAIREFREESGHKFEFSDMYHYLTHILCDKKCIYTLFVFTMEPHELEDLLIKIRYNLIHGRASHGCEVDTSDPKLLGYRIFTESELIDNIYPLWGWVKKFIFEKKKYIF